MCENNYVCGCCDCCEYCDPEKGQVMPYFDGQRVTKGSTRESESPDCTCIQAKF